MQCEYRESKSKCSGRFISFLEVINSDKTHWKKSGERSGEHGEKARS
jgi:hypothetical protein